MVSYDQHISDVTPFLFSLPKDHISMKKKDDIKDYCSAGEAAQILTDKLGRSIRPDYISKMAKSKKRAIRSVLMNDRILYHREDIAKSKITQKRSA
jgi:hypothetical protein